MILRLEWQVIELLGVPELEDRAIDELRFLAKLMKDIGTEESLQSSEYMLSIIQKALDGTFEIGD